MFFYNNCSYKTPVAKIRSFFFSLAVVILLSLFPTIAVYAEDTEENTVSFSQKIYHKHTGSSSGGGCYTVKQKGTKTEVTKCNGDMVYWPETNTSQCSKCGAGYSGDQSYRKCWCEEKETISYTYYELGCNQSDKTVVGTLNVTQTPTEWTKEVVLTGQYETSGKMKVADKPYIWNGQAATAENMYTVSQNGKYTLKLNADANSNTGAAVVSVNVSNIDNTAPVIRELIKEPESDWTTEGVAVTITDVADIQLDNTEGIGLHELPYSFDKGETWTVENSFLYTTNGEYTIWVRDALENTAVYNLSCSNIDTTGPTIHAVDYDKEKNVKSVVLTVTAEDLQPDGSAGAGLHEEAYSYDGGKTWTGQNIYEVVKNRTIEVWVRDKLGNIGKQSITVSNIDCMGPEILYKCKPASWTNQDVELSVWAKDVNEDGSPGIGLEERWCSLDHGKTWSDMEDINITENQTVTVIARDKLGNRSTKEIRIKHIDRELPWVTLSKEVLLEGETMVVRLTAHAGDGESGLHESAYSWNKGHSYGTEQTMIATENGTYQVTVRDKAGNWRYAMIDVTEYPEEIMPTIVETEPETEFESEEESLQEDMEETEGSTEETEEETIVVAQPIRVDKPKAQAVKVVEEDSGFSWKDALMWLMLLLLLLALLLFLFLLWMRTIAIYAENEEEKMKYIGRQWIRIRDERYEVVVSEFLLEQCVTTHFELRPSSLFAKIHKGKEISCLFPEDICIIKEVENRIDISLL